MHAPSHRGGSLPSDLTAQGALRRYGTRSQDPTAYRQLDHELATIDTLGFAGYFWSTLKIELVYRRSWRTRDEAENAIFAYIDGWYNTQRIQKDLGWLVPDEHETAWYTHQANPAILTPEPAGERP